MLTSRVMTGTDRQRFNDFVAAHPKGHFLQRTEWGDVKASMGWECLPLAVEEAGEIKAALLILKRRLPLPLVKRCVFYAPRGPVADVHDLEVMRALIDGSRRLAREHGAIFLKIDPDIKKDDEIFAGILRQLGFHRNETGLDFEGVQPAFVFRLNIADPEEEILARMHSKTRYNIRLAEKKGVIIREASDREDLQVFYRVLTETADRDQFLIRDYGYFESIWDNMVEKGLARIFLGEYQGQVIAGTLALCLGSKTWYLYGASSNEYRNVMPNYLIQWAMICWARRQGCTLYDFRGVSGDMDESNPLYGLYRFKKGFNGEFTEFIGDWDLVYSSLYYFLWTRALPVYRDLIRKKAQKNRKRGDTDGIGAHEPMD